MKDEFGEINKYPDMEGSLCHSKRYVLSFLEYLVLLRSKPLPKSKQSKKKKERKKKCILKEGSRAGVLNGLPCIWSYNVFPFYSIINLCFSQHKSILQISRKVHYVYPIASHSPDTLMVSFRISFDCKSPLLEKQASGTELQEMHFR